MKDSTNKPDLNVTLENVKTGALAEYRRDHAEAILDHESKLGVSCWKIPTTSNLTFENGKLVERTSDKAHQGTGPQSGAKESNK